MANLEITIRIPDLAEALAKLADALSRSKDVPDITADYPSTTQIPVTQQPKPEAPAPQPMAQTAPPQAQQRRFQAVPVQTPQPAQMAPQQPAPTAQAPQFSMDDLARAAAALMDAGKQPQLIQLLQQFGVQSLVQLPKEQLGNFATALRQMGARI